MMSKMMMGTVVGFMAGAGLMMTATGRALRKDVQQGMQKAKAMMKDAESH